MTRNGGQVLVESLVALEASRAFGVPGESYLAVLDALYDQAGRLDFVVCRNEGGASFAAAAWGKLTGRPGLCFVTRGPGASNAAIGVHTARQDSAPMILFVGQVGGDMAGREAFQELDYRAVFGTIAKWATQIDRVERIPEILARAWSVAVSGRPGPVVIALPEDMLTDRTDAAPLPGPVEIAEAAPEPGALASALAMLEAAERPLILTGGCNWTEKGRAALQHFAEESDIPVLAAFRYQDRLDNHSPVYAGEAGVGMPPHVRDLMTRADTILAVNVRFGEMTTAGYDLLEVPTPKQRLIHVHGAAEELGKIYRPALGLQAGPNAFAAALAPVAGGWSDWRAAARAGFEASLEAPAQPSPVDMAAISAWLRQALPEDVIVTCGAGNFTVWPNKFLTYGPKARMLGPQSGAMGYALPAAIAASVSCPDRLVVCFAGDGEFQMTCQELATAAQAGARVVILIVNNGIYGTIRAHQERSYPDRVSGTSMINPDFAALARAYGLHGERVEHTGAFEAAFERARASATGAVLDLAVSPEAITPRQTLSQIRQAARDAAGREA
ncbi:MAG: thiamine pyrophosphate-dependent enzyme [Marinibacterium sp.]